MCLIKTHSESGRERARQRSGARSDDEGGVGESRPRHHHLLWRHLNHTTIKIISIHTLCIHIVIEIAIRCLYYAVLDKVAARKTEEGQEVEAVVVDETPHFIQPRLKAHWEQRIAKFESFLIEIHRHIITYKNIKIYIWRQWQRESGEGERIRTFSSMRMTMKRWSLASFLASSRPGRHAPIMTI